MVRLSQDGVGGGEVDEVVEGRSALRGPDEGCAFLEKI